MKARDNPFASERVLRTIGYRPMDLSWPQILSRGEAMRWRGAIVGPKGTGKTTLLEALARHHRQLKTPCRIIRLSAESPRFPRDQLRDIAAGEMIFLDGAEQLSSIRWRMLRWAARRARGLVITSHAPGRLPTLLETRTTPPLLQQIVAELLDEPVGDMPACDKLLNRHHGNIRDALCELYDRHARIHR